MTALKRVDILLVERNLAESRNRAQALILSGRVFSGQVRIEKSGTRLDDKAPLTVREQLPYVSRGGVKLKAALDRFQVNVSGAVCLDVGASTGGFTDCLLKEGARSVYCVDVGYGQLDWNLRNDPRVTVMERTNFRTIGDRDLPRHFDLAVVDVSFISLKLILPRLRLFLVPGAGVILLVKPQFEAGPDKVGKGGIVRDPQVREAALHQVLESAQAEGFRALETMESPIRGAGGNLEYLVHLRWCG
ncbi:MAG: TlyA family RNA methyltransferase [bacterium]|nr:MAG: TlyA family RNA methyltransferase [bacterium]